jgi:hypothetical protein
MPEQPRSRGGAKRLVQRLRSKLHTDLHERLHELQKSVGDVHGLQVKQSSELEHLQARVHRIEAEAHRVTAAARHLYDEEPANRRRLHQLRQSEEYELAFSESEPLVSLIIPTYRSFETLRDVALPSALGQDYSNLEVIVSGDCAPPETAAVIAEIDDPRVVYINRTIRGPYSEDPARRWFSIGVPPFGDAVAIARGRWIAALGDDDAVRPNHTRDLVAVAQEHRYEHCYGLQEVHFAEGEPLVLGEFPPRLGHWGLQAAIYHAGLRYFEGELADEIFEEPSDWSKCRRMIRAGVRFGMIDTVVVDKHETRRRSAREWTEGEVPVAE